jgi:hypothetical protein
MQLSIVLGLALSTFACTGVGVGVRGGYYPGYYYGRGPFWGYGGDRVVVVPPDGGGIEGPDIDRPEAVPLPMPEPPMDMGGMDMGMPDMGGMDMGGFDF